MKPMLPARRRAPRWAVVAACVLATVGVLLGCGADRRDYANLNRPPVPVVVSASIDDSTVTVSPRRLGAGPITLVITNQSKASQQVTLEQDARGAPADATVQTGPINPRETAQIQASVEQGAYALHVGGTKVRAAHLVVGRERASAQHDLMTP
jgi:hypothetical protein